MQSELHRLTVDDDRFDNELRSFLGRTYNLKAVADYETGPESAVTVEQADEAIVTASPFLNVVEQLLA